MKKLSIIVNAALALAAAACTQEKNIDQAVPEGMTVITAGHTQAPFTRTSLVADESEESRSYTILWDVPDKILVGYAGGSLVEFTSKNTEPAEVATFTGLLPKGSGSLYGIYPALSDNTVNSDGSFSIAFKADQEAIPGSFDPEAFPAIAVAEDKNLNFMNICSLLALKVADADVVTITLSGNGGACFYGGTFTVLAEDEPTIDDFTEDVYEITLTADSTFDPEETYYMSVPPITFADGVIFTITHEDGSTNDILIDNEVTAERSKVHEVPTLTSVKLVTDIQIDCVGPEVEVGSTLSLAAVVIPGDATNQEVEWSVDDEDIATLATDSESGTATLTGEAAGTVTVTATALDGSGVTGTLEVTVKEVVTDPYNGYEYVDLGLPSNLKWATCNIGADSPEEYGDYFAWADSATKDNYDWSTYKWMQEDVTDIYKWKYITKYTCDDGNIEGIWYYKEYDGEEIMNSTFWGDNGDGVEHKDYSDYDYEDDPAVKIWGGTWRTPTPEDFEELINNTTITWTDDYEGTGVAGRLFTANNGNIVFLPAAGYWDRTIFRVEGTSGLYWSSSIHDEHSDCAWYMSIQSEYVGMNYFARYYGLSVRPVAE